MLNQQDIKHLAAEAGFDLCGVAPCRHLAANEARFRRWLGHGYQSSLAYLERHTEKRFDPARLVKGARTAVVCAVAYRNRTSEGYPATCRTKIASYACTTDYHTTIRGMLHGMLQRLKTTYPGLEGRAFVDTAPLAEKQLAVGGGWRVWGRRAPLATAGVGSVVRRREVSCGGEADTHDAPSEGCRGGRCGEGIDHCAAGGILDGRVIERGRCIACHTIEREPDTAVDLDGWIFGCDACQSCCPYNRCAPQHRNPAFDPLFDPTELDAEAWHALDERQFTERFGTTPLTRSGLARIRGNIRDK